ncbi:VOC family protein [Methanospirillum lacunae]|nr:VOC family protein [Methanospirillum lacunae]
MKTMNPVVHFEMPYEEKERLVQFYTQVFGWDMNYLGKEMGEYVVASTTETDENHMPIKSGAIGGGFYPNSPDMPKSPSVVIAVEDINAAIKRVTNAGGKILGQTVEIPSIGQYVAIIDSEGNRVGMLQPFEM